MGTGKRKIEIEKITKKMARMVAFSKRNINSIIKRHFPSCIGTKSSDVSGGSSGSKSSSTPKGNGLRGWVEDIDVEGCQNMNQLLMLKEQLEGTRKKIVSKDSESFQAFLV
ncbi:hypothetical protein R3W88_002834 [Solanum pinnatisectum]|uniref:MADS-box domain-containing protein n=1 Tax=Solanum pinnatisectum TaxID=50273 RepID=A0AAV9MQZ0_9SOLN|nr:hypothetical protein R3W88_002834 [Solanum pinnatisectum]